MEIFSKHQTQIDEICAAHKVERLFVFGSVAKGVATDQSDIDFLVRFKQMDLSGYLINLLNFKEQLSKLFKKEVDIIEEQTLSNPYLIQSINQNKKLVYG
jgi:predicted nucleotidyltransferase